MSLRSLSPLAVLVLLCAGMFLAACERRDRDAARGERENAVASIAGQVEVAEGLDASAVMVFAEGTSHMALTDGEGRFELGNLRPGTYRLRATRSDLETTVLGEVTITEEDTAEEQPFARLDAVAVAQREAEDDPARREVARLGSLSGTIETDPPGNEGSVTVYLQGTRYRTVSYDDGFFELINVEPGTYELVAARQGFSTQRTEVEVQAGQEVDLDPLTLEGTPPSEVADRRDEAPRATRTIYGQVEVLTGDGSVPSDYSFVRVNLEGTNFTAIPDSEGRFQFTNLPAQTYVVSASATNYLLERRYEVNLEAMPAAEVDLLLVEDTTRIERHGTIAGRVVLEDAPDNVHSGVQVSVAGTDRLAFTDSQGEFEFLDVEPGTYDLLASFTGYHDGRFTGVEVLADRETDVGELELERDVVVPRIVYASPGDGARDVTIEHPTVFTIQFNTNMDIASVRDAISISPEASMRVVAEGTPGRGAQDVFRIELAGVAYGNNDGGVLRFGTRYTLTVGTRAESLEGVAMRNDHNIRFTTSYPEIIATVPEDGASNVSVFFDRPIRVFFNAPIDPESVRPEDISFRPELPGSPNVYLRRDPQTGWSVLFIAGFAEPGTDYTVSIRSGLRTITRDRIRNIPYRFSFSTREWREFEDHYGLREPGREALRQERGRR